MTDDLKDIFAAIDQINLPKNKKKNLEVKKNFEEKIEKPLIKKEPFKQDKTYSDTKNSIPTITENFILEAEQQLKSLKKKTINVVKKKIKNEPKTLKEIQEEIISILGNLVDEKTRGFIEKQLEYSKFERVFSYINYMALKKKTKQVRSIAYVLQAQNSKLEEQTRDLALTLIKYRDDKNKIFRTIHNQIIDYKNSFTNLSRYSIKVRALGQKLNMDKQLLEKELSNFKKQLENSNVNVDKLSEDNEKITNTLDFYKEEQKKLIVENTLDKKKIENLLLKIKSYESERDEIIRAKEKLQNLLNNFSNVEKISSLEPSLLSSRKKPEEIK